MVILASYHNTEQRIILTICQDFTLHTDLEFRDFYLSVDDNRENAIMVMNLLGLIFLFLYQLSGKFKDSIHWITDRNKIQKIHKLPANIYFFEI